MSSVLPETAVLVQDSYYLTRSSRESLIRSGTHFINAVNSHWWKDEVDLVDLHLAGPGSKAAFHKKETGEIFLGHASQSKGRKYVLTNAFELAPKKCEQRRVPIFDEYGETFNSCDKFNKLLFGRGFPFRRGAGPNKNCCDAHEDRFYFDVLLVNCWILWRVQNPTNGEPSDISFCDFCVQLAKEIVEEALKK